MRSSGARAALVAVTAALAAPLSVLAAGGAAATPALPDFGAYPRADAKDFVVRDTQVYSVRGFTTPEGVFCTSSTHRGMSSLDCFSPSGPLPGAPDDANTVHLRRSGNVLEPVAFTAAPVETGPGPVQFEGTPLRTLPPALDYAFDQAQCVRDASWQLACVMDNGTQRHGFVISAGHTEGF
ncbi:hypothetical protein H7J07_06985 [Mycobacterium koreense]|uniref:Uncharacterized protein n=1 Tax=Mycolicibacillus koreensis TaxID=1069220 RepID=A0A7I7SCC5_9MYCO|nr:hypothetical protein [Mycolicibacillus koreensis]MCV7247965.1 hypothetical protein [Mycolicibacillus koreensis]OSC33199.1 hypothetical protein B8W67_11930 [Mycolicibacillus koreensis]BBY54428.1 hypothetical protein MKOR_16790 [Mycolicibacillus koreensis]